MPKYHHELGCINCGKPKPKRIVISGECDVYYRDDNSNTLLRVGFCKSCFEQGLFSNYDHIKSQLIDSEADFIIKHDKEPSKHFDKIKNCKLIGHMSYIEYNNMARPDDIKSPDDYVNIVVKNES